MLTTDIYNIASQLSDLYEIKVQTRYESYTENSLSELERGNQLVQQIRVALERISQTRYERTVHQCAMHEMFILSCAPMIYGQQVFERHRMEIEDFFGAQYLRGVMVTAPRRNGKSESIVYFIVALLVTMSKVAIVCYGANDNATSALKVQCEKILIHTFGVTKFKKNSKQHIVLRGGNCEVHFFTPAGNGDR